MFFIRHQQARIKFNACNKIERAVQKTLENNPAQIATDALWESPSAASIKS